MDSKKIVEIITDVIAAIILLYVAFLILQKLSGHSPTTEEILVVATAALVVEMFRIEYKLGEMNEFKINVLDDLREIKKYLKP